MAFYHIVGVFRPDCDAKRDALHDAFNEHLAQHQPRVRLGGPLRDAMGERRGVVIIVEAESFDRAERFLAESPYTRADLYSSTTVQELALEVGRLG